MGCGAGSLCPSPAHRLLMMAYQDRESVNLSKLKAAIKDLSASQLDARDSQYHWSPLCLAALMDEYSNCAFAAGILLDAGADPFSGSKVLHETPLGKSVKYNNIKVLEQLLLKLDKAGWEKFTHMLAQPEVCKASHVPEGTWVSVDGRKGKTSMQYGSSQVLVDFPGLSNTVTFEDGSSRTVGPEKVTVIPQASSQALHMIHRIARKKGCSPEQLERLECIELADRKIDDVAGNRFRSGVAVMGGA
mmetsp:Transcript_12571/g.21833  ORF Transcript_12571/g.21833 Transcript_12571/m.21833 type:complete len:246 (-) Transcript_12571:154-891(-)